MTDEFIDYDQIKLSEITQGELSQLTGMSRLSINKYLRDGTAPTHPHLRAEYLKVLQQIRKAVTLDLLPSRLSALRDKSERLEYITAALSNADASQADTL